MTITLSDEKLELIRKTVCVGATDAELALFLHVCQQTQLDPFTRQIYSIKRGNARTIQTGIDGLRAIAERTGMYSPGRESTFEYDENKGILSATSYIKKMTKDGTWHEIASKAFMREYNPGQGLWSKMPHVMLSKCAEANALRKAFPQEMCGVYVEDEMAQADKPVKEEPKIEYLSKEQIDKINELLGDDGKLLNWFHAKLASLEILDPKKIPEKWFNEVCVTINNKKKELSIQS